MTTTLTDIQNLVPIGLFVLGLLIKSPLQWKKANNDIIDTLTRDFQSLKMLYDSARDDVKNRDERIIQLNEDLAQVRARCQSYENFLQSRTFETDKILKQVPGVLTAVAEHLNIPLDNTGLTGHEAAHSQVK